jgi:hypothetical protein
MYENKILKHIPIEDLVNIVSEYYHPIKEAQTYNKKKLLEEINWNIKNLISIYFINNTLPMLVIPYPENVFMRPSNVKTAVNRHCTDCATGYMVDDECMTCIYGHY